MDKYKAGSKWRKWDLHIHTPQTKLNDQFITDDGTDVWDLYCQKINNSDVDVFGITDYFSVDNYFAFISKFNAKYRVTEKRFFPNVEFRIDSKNKENDHIQIHVIFSNEQKTLDKLANFFTRLELVSTDDVNLTRKYCTSTDLQEVTFEKAMVRIKSLQKLLESDFSKNEYVIVGLATGYGSLRPANGDGRGYEYAKEMDKICDFFFGKSDNVDFFLNKVAGRAEYKLKPKPVVTGCDAHSFEALANKLGNKYLATDENDQIIDHSEVTWIKANPTFEGLRQIIFEPEDRVRIQELMPDEKEQYRVIDKVTISDSNFTDSPIELNSNLNVIIGSRSSGKTTLLGGIAKAVDTNEYSSRHGKNPPIKQPPTTEVLWSDGTVSGNTDVIKNITYIPQNYINNLAEATEESSDILEIAENALFGAENGMAKKRSDLKDKLEQISRTISSDVFQLFAIRRQITEHKEKIKKIGDKKGIEGQIKLIEADIAKLQKSLTKEEAELLKNLRAQHSANKVSIDNLKSDIESLKSEIAETIDSDNFFQDRFIPIKSESLASEVKDFIQQQQKEYITRYSTFLSSKLTDFSNQATELEQTNKKLLEDNKTLIDKSRQNISAEVKVKEKEEQEKKLLEISKTEDSLKAQEDLLEKIIAKIITSHKLRSDTRNAFVAEASGTIEGIEYKAVVGIDFVKLKKFFDDNINFHHSTDAKTTLSSIPNYKNGDDVDLSILVNNTNIQVVLHLLLKDTLKLKAGADLQKTVDSLFSDFEFINYSLIYEGDSYREMTPGKKSLVVLKLLVESSEDKYPILIDQPEDDLDSRSISGEIVDFLREKKKERQIILVTHNANIAIRADAEEIIVANRHSPQHQNRNNIEFDYTSGAIEESFFKEDEDIMLEKMGAREHACELLEGGEVAFENRRNKYNLK